jgi:hypothetical protein
LIRRGPLKKLGTGDVVLMLLALIRLTLEELASEESEALIMENFEGANYFEAKSIS